MFSRINGTAFRKSARELLQSAAEHRFLLLTAAVLMGISAVSTALYAYLLGPVLKTLFLGISAPLPDMPASLGFFERMSRGFTGLDPVYVGAAVVLVAALKSGAYFGSTAVTAVVGQRLLHSLRARLYAGLLAQNPLNPDAQNAGTWTVRLTADVSQVEEAVTKGIVSYFQHGIEIIALVALAVSMDPMLALLGLVGFPPAAFVILRLGKKIRKGRASVHQGVEDIGTSVGETAAGLSTIHAFHMAHGMYERFVSKSRTVSRFTARTAAIRAASAPFNEILGATALAATLVWASKRIMEGALSPEAFISFFSALLLLYQPVKGLGQAHHATLFGIAALDRILPLLGNAPIPSTAVAAAPSTLRLEGISAGYDAEPVLEDLHLEIHKGERIAVIGPSGSGKTTLLNLLLGFLSPKTGRYLVDDRPFAPDDTRLFAPVRQEPFLFDDSIYENIRAGLPNATEAEITGACETAGVNTFADTMKDGIRSPVGPFGRALSLGQQQRVCLARALVSTAPILLLDEVTASLDGETERSIVDGLRNTPRGRTVLVVTHRLRTAAWADRIVLIENGTVSADGPSAELLSHPRIVSLFGKSKTA